MIRLVSLLCLLLTVAACAPRQAVVDLGVAATLTALAPTPILPAARATSTPVPTVMPVAASDTPAPAEVASPATEAPSATAAAQQAAATPTETPAAAALGQLIFEDTFAAPGGWAVGDAGDSIVSVNGGVLSFTQKTPGAFSFRVIGRQGDDFYAEVTTALANSCGSGDKYGLIFRQQDVNNYYVYMIDCDGRYRFMRYGGGVGTPLVDWTPAEAIRRGAKSVNHLALRAQGNTLTFFVNDSQLGVASDSAFATGRFGLWVGANVTQNFTIIFDDLRAYRLP